MFKILGNAWKIADLRKKILYTLMILLVYRVGCAIPVPGVDVSVFSQIVGDYSILGYMDLFSGGSLSGFTLFAMGITPYITASIIMNLLTIAIPALERLSKEGEDGRKKIASITRYVGVGLGLVMSVGIMLSIGAEAMLSTDWFNYVTIVACLTAGTALIMWMGERINEKGIGNGISLIIFIGIISSLPNQLFNSIEGISTGAQTVWPLIITVVVALIVITGITFVDMGERRIPVQYAKRVVGRKQYGGQTTYIPMKVNQSGVMPLIFALTLIQFPGMITQMFWPTSDFYIWYQTYLGAGSWIYMVIYALLILFFTYFYSQISFNPIDVSKNMQQHGGFIPGIRPGKPTSDHLAKILSKITFAGAVFLAIVAAVPTLLGAASGDSSMAQAFGATSLLIMVSVALETTKQIESQMMMRHYKGFLG